MAVSTPSLLIFDSDFQSRGVIAAFLKRRALVSCDVLAPEEALLESLQERGVHFVWVGEKQGKIFEALSLSGALSEADVFLRPVRLGALFERLLSLEENKTGAAHNITIGAYYFDVEARKLCLDGSDIDLTDKECDLLLLLHEQRGQTVSRQVLLSQIWGYKVALETHTLETHIYRLRRKIEENPSAPVLLVTCDDGYCLQG